MPTFNPGIGVANPAFLSGGLFHDVQMSRIFSDSKVFVDAIPRYPAESIVARYLANKETPGFDLRRFVSENFELPGVVGASGHSTTALEPGRQASVSGYVQSLWDELTRPHDTEDGSSLIALPNPYIVPGGRFREIYYWDTFFTLLGLESSRPELVESVVDNFAYLIDTLGFIPNGNRTYFCSRSQPPKFAAMLEILARIKGEKPVLTTYLPQLLAEYQWWMQGAEDVENDSANQRVVCADHCLLNRYWDNDCSPRPESYIEDIELARLSNRDASELYRDIRAACESGWDFSTRWLANPDDFCSIQTTALAPVDLNCMIWNMERLLARAYGLLNKTDEQQFYASRAQERSDAINRLFFSASAGVFSDVFYRDARPTNRLTLAAAYPMYCGLATQEKAQASLELLHERLMRPGGWVTTANHSGQQWDAPNGWAPLQWVMFQALQNYGYQREAEEGARRWLACNEALFAKTGLMFEKYDVEDIDHRAGGGEYGVQTGFGWSNAIYTKFKALLG